MSRPAGIRETKPRKRKARNGTTDGESYGFPDSGCEEATRYLKQYYRDNTLISLCFECPFLECKLMELRKPGGKNG